MPHSYSTELYHHGILGMKHGHRNGPPYPLQGSSFSSAEKSKGAKESKWADGTPKGYKPKKKSLTDTINSARKDYYKSQTKKAKAKLKKREDKLKVVSEREKAIQAKHEAKMAKQELKYARKFERQAKTIQKLQDKRDLKSKKEEYKLNKRKLKARPINELTAKELSENMDLYDINDVKQRLTELDTRKRLDDIAAADSQRGVNAIKNLIGVVNTGISAYDTYATLTGKEKLADRTKRLVNEKLNDKNLANDRKKDIYKAQTDAMKDIAKADVKRINNEEETQSYVRKYADPEAQRVPENVLKNMSREQFDRRLKIGEQVPSQRMNSQDIQWYFDNVAHNENKNNNNKNKNNGEIDLDKLQEALNKLNKDD